MGPNKSQLNSATRRRSRRRLDTRFALVVALVAAVPAVTWVVTRPAGTGSAGTGTQAPGVAHVHGLGINPADGALVVATHHGGFRLAEGERARRIGDSQQDIMGFTVVGPDRFLGSGHPDLAGVRRGLPGRLGLIESDDAGRTWRSVSLSGEVDFHSLAYVDGRVYGWDSGTGRFMVSEDRRSWDTRSRLDLLGFALDPGKPDHVVGATRVGVVESTDGGRSWGRVEGPPLVVLSGDGQSDLWGADRQAGIWRHRTDGWNRTGQLAGQPQALLASPGAVWAAVLDGEATAIYRSTDGGASWQLRHRE